MRLLRFTAAVCLATLASLAATKPDRALVALRSTPDSAFLSWRLFRNDPAEVAFQVSQAETASGPFRKLPSAPIHPCHFTAQVAADREAFFRVEALQGGRVIDTTTARLEAQTRSCVTIKLQGSYRAQKVGLGDFDGDGRLDFLVKQPDFNTDPYQQPGYWKKSEDTYKLEAYRHDGTFLWRYDMGWAIEEGIWYSPVVVYDLDGDGRSEVYCKAGEGDPREPTGHVRTGPEFLVKLDPATGQVVRRLPWPSRDGIDDYNYYSRNLLGIAWLDGRRPHLIVQRGTYTLIKVEAYDPDLSRVWAWDSGQEREKYAGQGMHGMHCVDVDRDGRDEIVLGSAVLDDTGRGLWTRGVGHPDACYVADIDPARPGLEIFCGIEPRQRSNAVCLVEARTGQLIWGNPEPTVHVHSQGLVADLVPDEPGLECYAGESKGGSNYWFYTATGKLLGHENLGDLAPRAVYWLDGSTKVFEVGGRLLKYPREEVARIQGRVVAIADFLGDWREEIVTTVEGELRAYPTTVPTALRRAWLMEDRLYRNDVAVQTMGYFYPPQLGEPLLPPSAK
jgi:rhamnogalacturonan endolyase